MRGRAPFRTVKMSRAGRARHPREALIARDGCALNWPTPCTRLSPPEEPSRLSYPHSVRARLIDQLQFRGLLSGRRRFRFHASAEARLGPSGRESLS